MIYMININTEIFLRSVKDLNKLKLLVEVNNLDRPNFSAIARELGVDRRTVKKYYDGDIKKVRKSKKSKIDDFYDIISSLLSAETDQIFYYKSHLYRYLVREKGLDCSRSNFNYYILKHEKFAEYFKPNKKKDAVKSETSFGKQAQFDWKEKLKFSFKNGEEFIFNVGSLILSASRFKYWAICPSTSQAYLFDFLTNAFEALGGVPKEIVIDNASTMMDKARTERSDGKVNPKFQQFADDFGFNIVPCIRARPNTKTIHAKVNSNGLFRYKGNLYSVPVDFINKNIVVKVIDNNLYVYYDHKLITLHTVSNKKINYHENHHLAMMSLTFRNSDKEDVKNYAAKHLEEMKKFNEQLSTVTEELT